LKTHWQEWDALIDRNHRSNAPAEERQKITAKMVDLLNRRNYIRNLVRDVNAALED
jgi:molecular chaperone HscB